MRRSWLGGEVYLVEVGADTALPILAEIWGMLACDFCSQRGHS